MCAGNKEKSKKYADTESSFDDLKMEEKLAFLVESTVKMVAQGVQEAGEAVTDALDTLKADIRKRAEEADGEQEEAEAATEKKSEKSSDAPKKSASAAKKKTTKKKKPAADKDSDD